MPPEKNVRIAPYAIGSGVACALAIGASMLLPEASRMAGVFGAVAASAGALCALSAFAAVAGRGTQGILLGFTIGFLCRAALIGIGLVASGARGSAALVYVGCFFALYLATQIIEILFVARTARPLPKGTP